MLCSFLSQAPTKFLIPHGIMHEHGYSPTSQSIPLYPHRLAPIKPHQQHCPIDASHETMLHVLNGCKWLTLASAYICKAYAPLTINNTTNHKISDLIWDHPELGLAPFGLWSFWNACSSLLPSLSPYSSCLSVCVQ